MLMSRCHLTHIYAVLLHLGACVHYLNGKFCKMCQLCVLCVDKLLTKKDIEELLNKPYD